jgi:uncharacterized protein (TIGR00266 family)
MLVINLQEGEKITGEAGALTYMTPNIEVRTRTRQRGLLSTLKTSILGGQSFFVNDYYASSGPGELALVAAPIGDIEVLNVENGRGWIIQKSSYLASDGDIDLDIRWEGFTRGLFGQGLFMIKATGNGNLFLNSFGAIDKHELKPQDEIIVDNFHLIAFSDSCEYEVRRFGGWKETILSGEGFVTHIRGPGEVYIQTKNLREFIEYLWTLLQKRVQSTAR